MWSGEPSTSSEALAALCQEYTRRQEALRTLHPKGVANIQAKIAERIEVLRLARRIEELEATMNAQPPHQGAEGIAAEGNTEEHLASASKDATPLPLQVSEEHLAKWRADVVAQQREVRRVTTQYQAVTEQLQQCGIGRGNWGTLVREQRFLAGTLEEQKAQLARDERMIALIEQGATIEEARQQVLVASPQGALAEEQGSDDLSSAEAAYDDQADMLPAEPAPRLEGQKLRQALFATLAQMFTTGDARHIALERGKFNRTIKNLVAVDVQPEDLPVLQATFERLWPKATCTALGLANNLPILIDKARMFGWQLR
jgi:hypothetical protein